MEHENYTINEVIRRMDSQDRILGDIQGQTRRTNGRVGALENWKWFITGGLGVIAFLLVPLIIFSIENYISVRSPNLSAMALQSNAFQSAK